MIWRIFTLITLVTLASGWAWYVFRDTPQKRIARWREEARYFLEKTADLEKAEELTDKILQIVPTSAHDLVFKAAIKERRGTPESLREALGIYDKVLSAGDANVLGVAFLKARNCRSMGLTAQAQATLLSVVDVFPFEAMVELGETYLAALAGSEAARYFTKALDVAQTRGDRARAHQGLADAYLLLASIHAVSSSGALASGGGAKSSGEQARTIQDLRSSCSKALADALSFVKSDDLPNSPGEANRRLIWATLLSEKMGAVKQPGETPCFDGVILVDGRRSDYSIKGKEAPALLIRLGALRLIAARDEAEQLKGGSELFEKDAEKDFLRALVKTPDEAKALLAAAQDPATWAEKKDEPLAAGEKTSGAKAKVDATDKYLQELLAISRVYLATTGFKRLLDDASELALSRRIADVMESGYPGASGLFKTLVGLARIRAGDAAGGEKLIDEYFGDLPYDARPSSTVELAEHALRLFPNEQLALRLLDRFEANGGKALDFLGKRVSLWIAAQSRPAIASEASHRIDEAIRRATESLQIPAEYIGVSKVLYAVRGREAATALMKSASQRYPEDDSVRRVHSDLLFEKGGDPATPASEMTSAYREAFGGYVALFVRAPGESQDVIRRSVEVLRKIEEDRGDPAMSRHLKPLFPTAADASLDLLAASVRAFFLAQFGPALDRAIAIPDGQCFRPFLSFLKGSCHVGLAAYLQLDTARASSDVAKQSLTTQYREHFQKALEEFREEPDFIPARLELANLELQDLPRNGDIPDDLLKRIEKLNDAKGLEHSGHYLLARALHRRFEHRYRQRNVKSSELVRLLVKEQRALRSALRKKPTFVPAYLALAESFLVADRAEGFAGEGGGAPSRQIFAPNHDKAISILKAVPNPDDQVTSRLAQYCEAVGKVEEASRYLERVASSRPTIDVFSRLFTDYLREDSPCLRVFLGDEPPAAEGPFAEENLRSRLPVLLGLRKSFEQLPEHQGVRYMFRAMEAERAKSQATGDTARKRFHEEMVLSYMKSLEAFDAKGLKVPLVVLNNLAWYLSEDPDSGRKARGLELARRGKDQMPSIADAPDAQDTYAWALFQNGKLVEAEQALRDLIRTADEPTYRYHLSRVLFAMKKLDEALAEIRRARDATRPFRDEIATRELEMEIKEARRKAVGE